MLINLCAVVLIIIHGVEGLSLIQTQTFLVKLKGKTASFRCEVTGLDSGNFVHWYHKKDGETFKRLLYISESGIATSDTKDFVSEKSENSYGIKLKATKEEHAGTYYCACWDGNRKVFGSGTRLYVTDTNADKVVPPILTGYLPSKKTSGKQTMLCQATKMFPDLVKFTWQKKSNTVDWTDVPEDNVVEQRNGNARLVTVTSMMILDQKPAKDDLYKCTAIHEGGTNKYIELKKDNKDSAKKPPKAIPNTTCPPNTEETLTGQISDTPEQMRRLYVFVYAYGVMLMKNGVYFCVISIFLLKRKFGKKEESS